MSPVRVNKAIVIAAGVGSRLRPLTLDKPKCLLDVGGASVLDRCVSALRASGVAEIAVVRGWKAELLNAPGFRYFENTRYETNNILQSLFTAEPFMDAGFIASYSDIVFQPSVVEELQKSAAPISVVIDTDWLKSPQRQDADPAQEGEVAKCSGTRVTRIGKATVPTAECTGEFIGMLKVNAEGARIFRGHFARLKAHYAAHPGAPFQRAVSFEKAYLTDFLQELVDRGETVESVFIRRNWLEIDTNADYGYAKNFFREAP